MSKKIIVILIVLIVLVISGYILWSKRVEIEEALWNKITEFITTQFGKSPFGGIGVPKMTTAPQSFGNIPEINPIDKTNPFKDIKTNPFE